MTSREIIRRVLARDGAPRIGLTPDVQDIACRAFVEFAAYH